MTVDFKRYGYVILLIILTGFFFNARSQPSGILINEFLASNVSGARNPQTNEFSDWIEIYNAGSSNIEVSGLFLTDDRDDPEKWEIPIDGSLPPGGYMLFWADGNDNFLHTNFKLKRSGGYIGLYSRSQALLDSITYGYQEDDISYGRSANDNSRWVFFSSPTPGTANTESSLSGKTPDPVFSIPGGFYHGSQTVSLASGGPGIIIHYTLDGSTPGPDDPVYTGPVSIDSTMAFRARAFGDGMLPGHILTETYFIDEPVNLPFVSLVTDAENFFDDSIGIYVIGKNGLPGYCASTPMNVNQDWERPVNVELYDRDGKPELNQMAGVKMFGGCSRTRYPLKSLALYARNDYGKGSFDCQLFKDKPIYSFQSFILRASGDDVTHTMLKDAIGQTLLNTMNIDRQAYRPVVLYINGQYWGILNMREKINEHFIAENYNVDPDEVNVMKSNPAYPNNVIAGSAEKYNSMIYSLRIAGKIDDKVYNYISSQMDIDNYIDYQIAEIYLGANDWPMNNIKYWNTITGPHSKFRWIIYDMDNMFFYINRDIMALATDPDCHCTWPNPPWSTFLFRRLLENENFRNRFIQRFAFQMNTTFQPDRIIHVIDSLKANIEPEIPRHIERWGGKMVPNPESWIRPIFSSVEEWNDNLEYMKRFVRERGPFAAQHIINHFGLKNGMAGLTISVDEDGGGTFRIDNQPVPDLSHSGDYFRDVPVTITGIPSSGYDFLYWDYSEGQNHMRIRDQSLIIKPAGNIRLVAHFTIHEETDLQVMINEINYHSDKDHDPGDWVEIYNPKEEFTEMEGWVLKDRNDDHVYTFSKGQQIGPKGFLVVCEDLTAFGNIFPAVGNRTGELGFGLSNGGELIRLYDQNMVLVDSVRYEDSAPWPAEADGKGPTLELTDPATDNYLPGNWHASKIYGTPGAPNGTGQTLDYVLHQNFPNPFTSNTIISYTVHQPGYVVIKISNIYGKEMLLLSNGYKEAANYLVSWNVYNIPSGIYFCTMIVDNNIIDTKKLVVTR